MKRRVFLLTLRRISLGAMVCAGLYLYQRFDITLAPGVGGGPVQRVVLDRWGQAEQPGARVLYANQAGLITQGWLVRLAEGDLILAPEPFIDLPEHGDRVAQARIRGQVILVLGAADVPLAPDGVE